MQDDVRFESHVLESARRVEQREGEAMAEAWWRGVERRCAEEREALAELARREPAAAGVNVERWRRAARLPVLVAALPEFAGLWRHEVPQEALERAGGVLWVVCRCGTRSELQVAVPLVCPSDCGRWFLRTERAVFVKVWPREAAA